MLVFSFSNSLDSGKSFVNLCISNFFFRLKMIPNAWSRIQNEGNYQFGFQKSQFIIGRGIWLVVEKVCFQIVKRWRSASLRLLNCIRRKFKKACWLRIVLFEVIYMISSKQAVTTNPRDTDGKCLCLITTRFLSLFSILFEFVCNLFRCNDLKSHEWCTVN